METITVRGKTFSEATVVEALQKHCNFEPEKRDIFQPGDIVVNKWGDRRIICVGGKGDLTAIDFNGKHQSNLADFKECGYRKIGLLSNFIARDC